ncbi:MAG: dTMP kinase [Burkholderiales bacterium]
MPLIFIFGRYSLVRSCFITFEGIDGAGKSTHLADVAARLRAHGAEVVLTREPGGTPLAEQLRHLLLHTPMDPLSEALIAFAGRRDHVLQVISPTLQAGHTVLCDRFSDATAAYQGGGRGLSPEILDWLECQVHPDLQPDLTFWFDLPAEVAAQRRAQARSPDRFEQQDTGFFERVRTVYAKRAQAFPHRFIQINAQASIEEVRRQIHQALEARGW